MAYLQFCLCVRNSFGVTALFFQHLSLVVGFTVHSESCDLLCSLGSTHQHHASGRVDYHIKTSAMDTN